MLRSLTVMLAALLTALPAAADAAADAAAGVKAGPAAGAEAGPAASAAAGPAADAAAGVGAGAPAGVRAGVRAGAQASAHEHFLTQEAAVTRILEVADQRMALMPGVAATKWQTHAPITDPQREQVVIKHSGELALPFGLAAEPVERVFEVQVRLAREWEESLTRQWQSQGFNYTGPIPNLTKEVRPQLDTITTQMLRALYLAAPVLRQPGFVERYTQVAETQLRAGGWSSASRQELLAALAGIRQTPAPAMQRIAATQVLRIGVTGDYAPFSIESGGTLSGADIDLAQRLAEHLHAQPVFIRTSWRSLAQDLRDDDFDLAMGGVSVTPERSAQGAFSIPYASGGKTIVARCVDASRFHDLEHVDRRNVRVVVNPGGTNEQYVREHLHRAQIREYGDNRTIFDELRAGRADVMITDDTEADLQVHRHSDLCRALAGTLTHADKAILMPQDSALVEEVNGWLKEAIASGEPARLLHENLNR
ncbi:MAG TPA: gamma subclass chorismate mutase AroQ [Steroidobacteraceae bacterium]|nr:gamma subclass chorismate mutase AroQ [Steroidobacteraceae bacterium]